MSERRGKPAVAEKRAIARRDRGVRRGGVGVQAYERRNYAREMRERDELPPTYAEDDTQQVVSCVFNPTHVMSVSRWAAHLRSCKDQLMVDPETNRQRATLFRACQYNFLHVVPCAELAAHERECLLKQGKKHPAVFGGECKVDWPDPVAMDEYDPPPPDKCPPRPPGVHSTEPPPPFLHGQPTTNHHRSREVQHGRGAASWGSPSPPKRVAPPRYWSHAARENNDGGGRVVEDSGPSSARGRVWGGGGVGSAKAPSGDGRRSPVFARGDERDHDQPEGRDRGDVGGCQQEEGKGQGEEEGGVERAIGPPKDEDNKRARGPKRFRTETFEGAWGMLFERDIEVDADGVDVPVPPHLRKKARYVGDRKHKVSRLSSARAPAFDPQPPIGEAVQVGQRERNENAQGAPGSHRPIRNTGWEGAPHGPGHGERQHGDEAGAGESQAGHSRPQDGHNRALGKDHGSEHALPDLPPIRPSFCARKDHE